MEAMGMLIPEHLRYTKDHLWIEIIGEHVKVGLTDYAQELLGTISFIELPAVETMLGNQSKIATIEGLKSVIDIFSPFECKVSMVNQALKTDPKLINSSPYDKGWIAELSLSDAKELDSLLNASGYMAIITQ
jgi:glycine cleavage system H protein